VTNLPARKLVGATIGVRYKDPAASDLMHYTRLALKNAIPAKDGSFVLDGVLPGMECELTFEQGGTFVVLAVKGKRFLKADPGATIDLGQIPVKMIGSGGGK
jgi:hypothetical protein